MHCPICRHSDTKVIDSRSTQEESIRRRRECLACKRRFTTYERIEETPLRVVKRDGRVVPFSREQLREGLKKAVYKRPVADEQVEDLIGEIEKAGYDTYERMVPSVEIGDMVVAALRELDQVAYMRFASVYSNFSDVDDFTHAIGEIQRSDRPAGSPQPAHLSGRNAGHESGHGSPSPGGPPRSRSPIEGGEPSRAFSAR